MRRFLSIFYPPAEYQTVKLVVAAGGEKLYTSAKQLKVPGYLEIAGIPKTAKERNAAKTDGGGADRAVMLRLRGRIREGKTSPPKRYTSGSMVLAMENAGQLIEEEELREQIRVPESVHLLRGQRSSKSWFGSAI